MKLYGNPVSGNTHRVKALLGILGVGYEDIVVDLRNGEHKAPDFLALNPLGQVPVLHDDELVLRDSTAILVYLARRFDPANTWLPADAADHAAVQQWLSTAVNEVQAGPFALRAIKLFNAPLDLARATSITQSLFADVMEPHLETQDWLALDRPTIADLACYSYVARVTEGDFSLEPYPAIRTWLGRVEAIDNFVPMLRIEDLPPG